MSAGARASAILALELDDHEGGRPPRVTAETVPAGIELRVVALGDQYAATLLLAGPRPAVTALIAAMAAAVEGARP